MELIPYMAVCPASFLRTDNPIGLVEWGNGSFAESFPSTN
jgi:hypothetical protein